LAPSATLETCALGAPVKNRPESQPSGMPGAPGGGKAVRSVFCAVLGVEESFPWPWARRRAARARSPTRCAPRVPWVSKPRRAGV